MNPLDQLQDIHLPQDVGMWPPAYGWWLLALLFLLVCVTAAHYWRKKKQWLKAKKAALQRLESIDQNHKNWHQDINALLKRLCLSYVAPETVANKHGAKWLAFLKSHLPPQHQEKFEETMAPVLEHLYQAKVQGLNFQEVKAQTALWIKHFKPKTSPVSQGITHTSKEAKHV